MATKKYTVRNPRGIPEGQHIIRFAADADGESTLWFEGDSFVRPKKMGLEGFESLVDQGFLEATDG